MKKTAIAFTSKNRVALTEQTLARVRDIPGLALFWLDGSTEIDAVQYLIRNGATVDKLIPKATGGPDRAIVRALTEMLGSPVGYDYVGIVENDVLLDDGWFEPTMELFNYSRTEGLPVGAVSARAYHDRVLIQRDGYAVMHNVGAGHVMFSRNAAQIILNNFRTGWWPENRRVFAGLSGIDIAKFAAFGFEGSFITGDWSWDTILASHGFATVALTPSKASMIGQDIPLDQQGLRLVQDDVVERRDDAAFERFRDALHVIEDGSSVYPRSDFRMRNPGGIFVGPHHIACYGAKLDGKWKCRWNQGLGPFAYEAAEDASVRIPLFGPCAIHVGGGKVRVSDSATGFEQEIDLAGIDVIASIPIPRDHQVGTVEVMLEPGAALCGVETTFEQLVRTNQTFDHSRLPEQA